MKKPVHKHKILPAHDGPAHGPATKADEASIDPATGRPVVRDLRFREFVAHQRDLYFLNLRAGQ
jgi:hypothetical protein